MSICNDELQHNATEIIILTESDIAYGKAFWLVETVKKRFKEGEYMTSLKLFILTYDLFELDKICLPLDETDSIYLVKIPRFPDLTKISYYLFDQIKKYKVNSILSTNDPICKICMAILAVCFDTGLAADCDSFSCIGNEIYFNRVVGIFPPQNATVCIKDTRPQMGTIIPGKKTPDIRWKPKIIYSSIDICNKEFENYQCETFYGNDDTCDERCDNIVFIAGAGISHQDMFNKLHDIAQKRQIGFGVTKKLVERGWIDKKYLVGMSGRTISPNICVFYGVSGSVQHMLGIKDANHIIAINNKLNEPIEHQADKIICADVELIIESLYMRWCK